MSASGIRIVASELQYRDHLAPLEGLGPDLVLVASTKDLRNNPGAVYMDHGCGLQWHGPRTLDSIRADARGVLAPNEYLAGRYAAAGIVAGVVGTPKLDALLKVPRPSGPVAISLHWTTVAYSRVLGDYRGAFAELAARVEVIGHGHPRAWSKLRPYWEGLGVEPVADFAEVVRRAGTYVCNHGSTIYEWAALDRPVVLLEVPGQERLIRTSSGLRYTDHAWVGEHATPETLVDVVRDVRVRDVFARQRAAATAELYPYLGRSVERALEVLEEVTWSRTSPSLI